MPVPTFPPGTYADAVEALREAFRLLSVGEAAGALEHVGDWLIGRGLLGADGGPNPNRGLTVAEVFGSAQPSVKRILCRAGFCPFGEGHEGRCGQGSVRTLELLCLRSADDLLSIQGCGMTKLSSIRTRLAGLGLCLAGEVLIGGYQPWQVKG